MWTSFKNSLASGNFWAGAVIGAAGALLASNPEAQKAILKTAAQGLGLVTNTLAEAKEKFADARAEVEVEAGEQIAEK